MELRPVKGDIVIYKDKKHKVAYVNYLIFPNHVYLFVHMKRGVAQWTTIEKVKLEDISCLPPRIIV